MFTLQDLKDKMAEAKSEGYGHAYMAVAPETEEIIWGYCGDKYPSDPRTTWVSPEVLGDKSSQAIHQDALIWLERIKSGLGLETFARLYAHPAGRPRLYAPRVRTSLEVSPDVLESLDKKRGSESRAVYIERVLRHDLGM